MTSSIDSKTALRPTRIRRAAAVASTAAAASLATASFTPQAQATEFVLSTATNLFTPSFRNAANTTFFGWADGDWDGNPDTPTANFDTLNRTPTLPASPGVVPAGAGMVHNVPTTDIVSASNNIFTGTGANFNVTLSIPTSGTPGTGFTTLIVQGRASLGFPQTGPGSSFAPVFGKIDSTYSPTYVEAYASATGQRQWWAEYEIPGNAATYSINLTAPAGVSNPNPISIADFTVDALWSPSGFASDVAVAPEPASLGLLGVGTIGLLGRRRRRA